MPPPAPRKPVVGLVGGIGSGKSLAANELVKLGGYLVPADQLGHEALRQSDIKAAVAQRWGPEVIDATGEVNRRRLGRIVFADPKELEALERLVFPFIEQRIVEEVEKADRRPDVKFIVLDAAIMLEAGWHRYCSKIVFVDAPDDVRWRRLNEGRGWSAAELRRRERAQMPLAEKRRRADAVLDNSAGPDHVARQATELLRKWGWL